MKTCVVSVICFQCGPVNNAPPPLITTIQSGNKVQVEDLIQQGSDVNAMDCVSYIIYKKSSH